MTIVDCTITENSTHKIAPPGFECGTGGGIKNAGGGMLTILNSTISNNEAEGKSGGLEVACDSSAVVINSTFSHNTCKRSGGGIRVKGELKLIHSTIAGNRSTEDGGGIYVFGILEMINTLIFDNPQGGDCGVYDAGYRGVGIIGVNSHNFIEDGSCHAEFSGDPGAGWLQANGGTTRTIALDADSPARDVIPVEDCPIAEDQRGRPRPANGLCDVGAFELQDDDLE